LQCTGSFGVHESEFGGWGLRCGVWGLGFRVQAFGFKVWGLEFGVWAWSFEFRVLGFESWIWGLGLFEVHGLAFKLDSGLKLWDLRSRIWGRSSGSGVYGLGFGV